MLSKRRHGNAKSGGGADQYLTPPQTARWAVRQTMDALGGWDGPVVEPSAGAGAFIDALAPASVSAYDINPLRSDIQTADWLAVPPDEYRDALVIGNPPYGYYANDALRFINHAARAAEAVAFILPPLFDRTTMGRRISLDMSLVCSVPVPWAEYHGPDGTAYPNQARVLQVWRRCNPPRRLDPLPDGSPWVRHLPGPEGADVFVVRNGSRAGRILLTPGHNIRFAWPMVLLREDALARLREVEERMVAVAKLGTAIPNMPKVEINVALQHTDRRSK